MGPVGEGVDTPAPPGVPDTQEEVVGVPPPPAAPPNGGEGVVVGVSVGETLGVEEAEVTPVPVALVEVDGVEV